MKRGTRRAGSNGYAHLPPAAPFSAVTRYRTRRRGPLRILGKILLWTLTTLLVAAGALAGGAWLFLNHSVQAVQAQTPEAREAQRFLDVPVPGAPAVAMVLGYDTRAGKDKGNPPRSDTIMLVRADPNQETVSMISFPRDLVVPIPGCKGHPETVDRINVAYTDCGPSGTLRTVKQLTGIPINYVISVNYRGFKQIVNQLGGVYMDVDQRYFNDRSGPDGYATIDLHAGYQKLSGGNALDFVRYRHGDSDLYRNVRQQEFVKAFKQQVASSFSLSRIPGIVNVITENVHVSVGGGEELDFETILGYARLLYDLPVGSFHPAAVQNLTEDEFFGLHASEGDIDAAVERFMHPDAGAAEKAATAATGEKPAEPVEDAPPPPSEITVEVLNGNGVAGAADEAAFLLQQRGYQAATGGNALDANGAPKWDYFHTEVLYDPEAEDGPAAADAVAALFGDAEVEAAEGAGTGALVQVILGQTYTGSLTPGARDATPEHEEPTVVEDATAAQLLEQVAGTLDFPVLAPTVRDAASSLDGTEPARAYRINGHDALRLVYRNGIDYWGIQQTSWTEAPILAGASTRRTIGGREYRLYFSGPRLHRIAFEENGAVYWVTNSLLDELSNETMIEIAKGLQPLGASQ